MKPDEVFVADTHALAWFLTGDARLSTNSAQVLRRAQAGDVTVYIPTIVLAEFLWLTKQGKVTWERFFDFIDRLEAIGGFRVAALDLNTFSRMTYIVMASPPPRPELELHDLSILATALLVDGKLIPGPEITSADAR